LAKLLAFWSMTVEKSQIFWTMSCCGQKAEITCTNRLQAHFAKGIPVRVTKSDKSRVRDTSRELACLACRQLQNARLAFGLAGQGADHGGIPNTIAF
jgi:hypothetical protein